MGKKYDWFNLLTFLISIFILGATIYFTVYFFQASDKAVVPKGSSQICAWFSIIILVLLFILAIWSFIRMIRKVPEITERKTPKVPSPPSSSPPASISSPSSSSIPLVPSARPVGIIMGSSEIVEPTTRSNIVMQSGYDYVTPVTEQIFERQNLGQIIT